MLFWIIAFVLAGLTAAMIAAATRRPPASDPDARTDIAIYRDQLAEVDRDLARNVLSVEDAARTRTEIGRRILAADRDAATEVREGPRGLLLPAIIAVVVVGAGGIYWALGGYGPDLQPQDNMARADRIAVADARFAARPSQADAEASWLAANPPPDVTLSEDEQTLVTRLREVVAQRPDELQGWKFLVDVELDLGNIAAAAQAQAQVLRLTGDAATLPDLERLLDLMVSSAGGDITAEAEAVLREILRRDPENGLGLYYAGLMRAVYGRPDLAFPIWRRALDISPEDAPWVAPIRESILDMAWFAGQPDYRPPETALTPPGALPGPTAQEIENAGDMTSEDQQAMIRGMVDQLGTRLAAEGGSPDEWARFIGALAVLGDLDRARAVWAEAQGVFAGDDAALAPIREAAVRAGVAE